MEINDEEGRRIVTDEEKLEAKNFNIFDLPDVPKGLPPHLELQRTRVVCNVDAPIHVRRSKLQSFMLCIGYKFQLSRNLLSFLNVSYVGLLCSLKISNFFLLGLSILSKSEWY